MLFYETKNLFHISTYINVLKTFTKNEDLPPISEISFKTERIQVISTYDTRQYLIYFFYFTEY